MTKIEQDAKRVNLYNSIQKNLDQIVIHKTNYDALTNEVNGWMDEIKALVDDENVKEFTPEDFDAVLKLRDDTLGEMISTSITSLKAYNYYEEPVVEEPNIIVTNE